MPRVTLRQKAVTDWITTLQPLLAITRRSPTNEPDDLIRLDETNLQTQTGVPGVGVGDRTAHLCGEHHCFQSASNFEHRAVHKH
ncbi:hypothetical protein EYF80_007072 [Liparis tanakae]|uniref:Uncharacterized protein n=1 Tax=Liparis tanakae TaxID=230148 RepID=A0A4Z2IYE9_9TELE|nr:hypothetical protein EYF80_007072 [Liparis tanakae]